MASVAYLVCILADVLMAIIGDKIGRKNITFILSATGVVIITLLLNLFLLIYQNNSFLINFVVT